MSAGAFSEACLGLVGSLHACKLRGVVTSGRRASAIAIGITIVWLCMRTVFRQLRERADVQAAEGWKVGVEHYPYQRRVPRCGVDVLLLLLLLAVVVVGGWVGG